MSLKSTLTAMAVALSITFPALAETEQQIKARSSLNAFNERFNEFAEAHNTEGLISLYHEDAYWIAPNKRPAKGRDGVPRETITFMSANKGELSHTIEDLFISEDGTQAVMKGVTAAAVKKLGFELEGTYIYVLKRTDESSPWEIVVDMYNNYSDE